MPIVKCHQCHKPFYAKPNWIKRGNGKYCSAKCHHESMKKGMYVKCEICGEKFWRKPRQLKHSKSQKFFCNKSHQTLWRNSIFVGPKHPNWKNGENIGYRKILLRNKNVKQICEHCGENDKRVLVVHHLDKNRANNKVKNLVWLCLNCHFLTHHYNINYK